jgi:hypothetical protein
LRRNPSKILEKKMRNIGIISLGLIALCISHTSFAETPVTKRIPQFANDKVNVWKTIIYPSKQQILKMHRHEFDRVLVAFDDGILRIKNDKGQSHDIKLEKERAYYLKKDIPGELHTDENLGQTPIKVLVMEIKN